MAESRSKRRARVAGLDPDLVDPALLGPTPVDPDVTQGPRRSVSQFAGNALRAGDKPLAAILEEALRFRERVDRATHGFHTWPAALHPDAAQRLLGIGSGKVLDPFCGGGGVLVESMLAGREALGLDIGSVACMVARARTWRTTEEERTTFRSAARALTTRVLTLVQERTLPFNPEEVPDDIRRMYEPHVYAELSALRAGLADHPMLKVVFSAILIKTSRRKSDTVNQTEDNKLRAPGTVATLFHAKAREYGRMLEQLAEGTGTAKVHREDAREVRLRDEIGQIVTSPPYPGVYDYVPMQSLRRYWLSLDDERALREEIGARRNFRADRAEATREWRADTHRWVKAMAKALVVGGRLVVVTGDGRVGDVRIDSWTPLDEAARSLGLTFISRATVERWDEGLTAMRPEHIGVWEKKGLISA